jgi:hypothetical protein
MTKAYRPITSLSGELYPPEWKGVFAEGESVEHLYAVSNQSGMRTEWYFHEHTLGRCMVLRGNLDVGLDDGLEGSATHGVFEVAALKSGDSRLANSIRITWNLPDA